MIDINTEQISHMEARKAHNKGIKYPSSYESPTPLPTPISIEVITVNKIINKILIDFVIKSPSFIYILHSFPINFN